MEIKSYLRELRTFIKRGTLSLQSVMTDKQELLSYRCNICGKACKTKLENLQREEPSCPGCGSTVRMRSLVHILSMELFGKSLTIGDFPEKPDVTGIGMSDWDGYATRLKEKLGYKNTYYHKEPRLDILGDVVELLHELRGTHSVWSQGRTNRRGRRCLCRRYLQLDDGSYLFLCHT